MTIIAHRYNLHFIIRFSYFIAVVFDPEDTFPVHRLVMTRRERRDSSTSRKINKYWLGLSQNIVHGNVEKTVNTSSGSNSKNDDSNIPELYQQQE